jgi:hypothetical protein
MPDTRSHRGPHPKDERCFAAAELPTLRRGVAELSWLLDRGYAPKAALELVGDRHRLLERQRTALQRCAVGDQRLRARLARLVPLCRLAGTKVEIDGYNVLLSVEAALSGGVLLLGRDGTVRDLAAMSSHYKRVLTTRPALEAIGRTLERAEVAAVRWLLDRPISNSRRLAGMIESVAVERGLPWMVELVRSPDGELRASAEVVATADSGILDRCGAWTNLARDTVTAWAPDAWLVDLSYDQETRAS